MTHTILPPKISSGTKPPSPAVGEGARASSPTLGDRKANLGGFPEQRLSLGKKVWRFLTFYNLRMRAQTKTPQQGGLNKGVHVGTNAKPRLSKKEQFQNLFKVPKHLFIGAPKTTLNPLSTDLPPPRRTNTIASMTAKYEARTTNPKYARRAINLMHEDANQKNYAAYSAGVAKLQTILNSYKGKDQNTALEKEEQRVCNNALKDMDGAVDMQDFDEQLEQPKERHHD